jgi:hypothetical protein
MSSTGKRERMPKATAAVEVIPEDGGNEESEDHG